MSWKSTLLSLLYFAKTSNGRKVYIAITFFSSTKALNTRKVNIAITFILCEDIQCHESLQGYHFCIVRRHPTLGKSILLSIFSSTKALNVRKVNIAITFIMCEDIQCHESLQGYHFCIVRRHPTLGKSTLLSIYFLSLRHSMFTLQSHCAKASNVGIYIAITLILC